MTDISMKILYTVLTIILIEFVIVVNITKVVKQAKLHTHMRIVF